MPEDAGIKIISRLGIDYNPAIQSTRQLMLETQKLDAQIKNLRITASQMGKTVGASIKSDMSMSNVILDRHGNILIDLNKKNQEIIKTTQKSTEGFKDHRKSVEETARAYSVLGSQWERRISWFLAGVGFYGFMRQMRQAVDTIRQIELDMVVIARTIDDATFSLTKMRDELQNLGMQYGHTWETVSEIALRWTQAGYDMADTLEMTRVGLLALNVAEMDVQMASQGLLAIMSQWGFQADELETVIDKLNITSDNFAVTTGDLVDALVRASGAARAVGMSFEETLGVITATRVATGRTGREVGNALNTIMAFLVRQQTLNKLMESGIEVFADAAQTKLRPAIEILNDIVERWGDNAEEMPDVLLDLAEKTGILSEEIAEAVGLQEEWNDLQKIDIETSAAGVRRRSFFIALLRNFAQVQEVVNNMHESEGYSMMQNIMTMETLEKQYQQLQVAMEKLAVVMGDTGFIGQLKGAAKLSTTLLETFNNLDDSLQALILSFMEIFILTRVVSTLGRMLGTTAEATTATAVAAGSASKSVTMLSTTMTKLKSVVGSIVAMFGGPWGLVGVTAASIIWTLYIQTQKANEEMEENLKLASLMSGEHERLTRQIKRTIEGEKAHQIALEQKRKLNRDIIEQFPELYAGYDEQNNLIKVNTEALSDLAAKYDELYGKREEELTSTEKEVEMRRKSAEIAKEEAELLKSDAARVEELAKKREILLKAVEDENLSSEEREKYLKREKEARKAIIRLVGEEAAKRIENSNWSIDAINKEIEKIKEKAEIVRNTAKEQKELQIEATRKVIVETRKRIAEYNNEIEKLEELKRELRKGIVDWPGLGGDIHREIREDRIRKIDEEIQKRIALISDESVKVEELRKEIEGLSKELEEGIEVPMIDDSGRAAGDVKSLTDAIRDYIEEITKASKIHELVNKQRRREIDLAGRRMDYFSRENATIRERIMALDEEARLLPVLRQQQEGLHRQAEALREVKSKLISRQNSLNVSSKEGRDAYNMLQTEIERINDTLLNLSATWFDLAEAQEVGISGLERIRKLREININLLESEIEYFTRSGASEEELARAEDLRSTLINKLITLQQQYNNQIREQEEYIETLNKALRDGRITQEQWNKAIVEANDELASLKISSMQNRGELEELEKTVRGVEKSFKDAVDGIKFFSRLGILTTKELIEYTRNAYRDLARYRDLSIDEERQKILGLADYYSDIFDGIRKSAEEAYQERIKALERSVEREISIYQRQLEVLDEEEQLEDREEARRQYEKRMEELAEERRYHELRTGIEHERAIQEIERQMTEEQRRWQLQQSEWEREDRREYLNKQIEDIRDRAEAQRKEWEKAYERMQADFDKHNIALLSAASAYDEKFFEDAKRKAELWIEGFKQVLTPDFLGDYLGSMVDKARGKIPISTGVKGAGETYGTPSDRTIEHSWGHEYKISAGGHIIEKDGRYIPPENFKYLPEDVLELARKMKAGEAHTGAMTKTAGIAELIPGELIFPPGLSMQLERLISVLSESQIQSQDFSKKINNFYAPLFGAERVELGDEVDVEIVGRELKRQIDNL